MEVPNSEKPKILIVDDDILSLEFLKLFLEDEGFEVSTAQCVSDARALACELRPQYILSDIQLPDGSGQDLVADLRKEFEFRAIAVTGFNAADISGASTKDGVLIFNKTVTKPVDLSHLKAIILG